MANTYIVVDSKGRATLLNERNISAETTARLAKGEQFKVYRAEPMKVKVTLTPMGEGAPVSSAALPASGTRKKRKLRRRSKTKRRSVASKTEAAADGSASVKAKPAKKAKKKTRRAKKAGGGKAGRPRTNVGPCTEEGCEKEAKTRGLCSAHYQRYRRQGGAKTKARRAQRGNKVAKK